MTHWCIIDFFVDGSNYFPDVLQYVQVLVEIKPWFTNRHMHTSLLFTSF
jgi:hypothetical protein